MKPNEIKETIKIEGMTCTSCEMRIENKLSKLHGVIEAKVSYANQKADITFDPKLISLAKITEAIESIDYKVVKENNNDKDKNGRMNIKSFLGIGIVLFAVYLLIQNTVGFNFIPEVNQNMGYGILFIVGILTSLHCVAMCGGINLSQCVSYKTDKDDKFSKLKPSILYNAGRVISYTLIGGIVGALGKFISLSGTARGIVAIAAGIFMVIMGLNMLDIFPWLRKLTPKMPKMFTKKINKTKNGKGPFIVGLLNGFMPCGPLQTMQIYALGTGSFFAGALSMFMFSLGTVPLMFGFGLISSLLSSKFTHKMMKVSAVLVMVLGVVMVNRGLSLSGINVAYAASPSAGNVAKIEGNVQTVTTTLSSGNYTPITITRTALTFIILWVNLPLRKELMAPKPNIRGTVPRLNINMEKAPAKKLPVPNA
jgi:sulfite exporter TauE/SafE/copper chaperone CopZ